MSRASIRSRRHPARTGSYDGDAHASRNDGLLYQMRAGRPVAHRCDPLEQQWVNWWCTPPTGGPPPHITSCWPETPRGRIGPEPVRV
jgi:hypothetical protein